MFSSNFSNGNVINNNASDSREVSIQLYVSVLSVDIMNVFHINSFMGIGKFQNIFFVRDVNSNMLKREYSDQHNSYHLAKCFA